MRVIMILWLGGNRMKKLMILGIISASVLFILSCKGAPVPTSSNITQGVEVGNLAPNFQLNDMTGKPVSLSDFRGKVVYLNFWATWWPICQAERSSLQSLYEERQNKDVVLLTIDIIGTRPTETPENLADFMQKNGYTFPVLLDMDRAVTRNYSIKATPTNILIDKNGIIRQVVIGEFPKAALDDALNRLLAN